MEEKFTYLIDKNNGKRFKILQVINKNQILSTASPSHTTSKIKPLSVSQNVVVPKATPMLALSSPSPEPSPSPYIQPKLFPKTPITQYQIHETTSDDTSINCFMEPSPSPSASLYSLSDDVHPDYELATVQEKIIESVRKREMLWNHKHKLFKEQGRKPKYWEEALAEIGGNITMEEMKNKWKHMRNSYARYKRTKPPSGSGQQMKQYKFGELMSFLDDTLEPRRTISTSISINDCENTDNLNADNHTTKKKEEEEGAYNKRKDKLLTILENNSKQKPLNETEYFGIQIGMMLQTLPEFERDDLKVQILKSIVDKKKELAK